MGKIESFGSLLGDASLLVPHEPLDQAIHVTAFLKQGVQVSLRHIAEPKGYLEVCFKFA